MNKKKSRVVKKALTRKAEKPMSVLTAKRILNGALKVSKRGRPSEAERARRIQAKSVLKKAGVPLPSKNKPRSKRSLLKRKPGRPRKPRIDRPKRPRGRPRKKNKVEKPKRPRGRPRKKNKVEKPKRPRGRPRKTAKTERPKRSQGRPRRNPEFNEIDLPNDFN